MSAFCIKLKNKKEEQLHKTEIIPFRQELIKQKMKVKNTEMIEVNSYAVFLSAGFGK